MEYWRSFLKKITGSTESCLTRRRGEMAEWSNAHAWKACVVATLPRVRIPLSPPHVIFWQFSPSLLALGLSSCGSSATILFRFKIFSIKFCNRTLTQVQHTKRKKRSFLTFFCNHDGLFMRNNWGYVFS